MVLLDLHRCKHNDTWPPMALERGFVASTPEQGYMDFVLRGNLEAGQNECNHTCITITNAS